MGFVIGHLCRHCGLETLEIACAACRGRITWSRRGGYRCSGCGEGPTAAACRECGTVAPLHSKRDVQPADRAVSETVRTKTRSPPPTWAPWDLEKPTPSGWPIFIGLAVFLHAALIVPLIAGRDGPDGASSAAHRVASTETVTVVDSSTIAQPAARDDLSDLPAASLARTDMPLAKRLVRAALDVHAAAIARSTSATPSRDIADDGAAETSAPLEAAAKPDAAVDALAPATATPGPGRGAALLPFDMLPIPTPPPPVTTAARRQKAHAPAAPSKPAVALAPRYARHPPAEPQPFDPQATMPDPAPTVAPAPMQPPVRDPRSRRAFWWGIWCGAYVSCD